MRLVLEQALEGHADRVWHLAWSPKGDTLASCSSDKTVRLWCRAEGTAAVGVGSGNGSGNGSGAPGSPSPACSFACAAKLEDSHTKTVRCAAWSPDGALLLTVSFDARAALWRRTLPPLPPAPSSAAAAADAADASADGPSAAAALLAAAAGRARWRQVWASGACHESEIKGADWSPCGGFAATCGRDRHVWVWELTAGGGENGNGNGNGGSGAMDEDDDGGDDDEDDGERAAAAAAAAAAPKEGAAALEAVDVKGGHSGDVKAVAWHPRGDGVFATVSYDDTVRAWAAEGGLGAAASGGGEWACEQVLERARAEAGAAVELEVWGEEEEEGEEGGGAAGGGKAAARAAAGAAAAAGGIGGGDEGARAAEAAAAAAAAATTCRRPFFDRGGHSSTVWDVRFSRHDGGARMATASADGTVRVWAAGFEPGSSGRRPAFAAESVVLAGFRPRGKAAAAAEGEEEEGGENGSDENDDDDDDEDDDDASPAEVLSVDWSARGLLATGDARNALRVFEPVGGAAGAAAAAAGAAAAATTTTAAETATAAAATPLPWRLAAQAPHPQDVNCVRWHPTDATLVATACDDGAVRLWRLVSD